MQTSIPSGGPSLISGLKAFLKPTLNPHQSPVPVSVLDKIRRQHFSSPTHSWWGLFWYFPGSLARECGGCSSQHSCPGFKGLGPSWPPGWGGGMRGGCLGGWQVRAGFLGPPWVLSSVATSEGPFVCPFIQKSGCDCIGYKAPVGPDFPPLPVAQQEEGFPGSHESARDPDLLFLGPRPVHPSSLHQLPAAPSPSPHHSHQPGAPCSSRAHIWTHNITSSCAKRWGRFQEDASFSVPLLQSIFGGLLRCRQPRTHWVWASRRGIWKVGWGREVGRVPVCGALHPP